MILRKKIAVVLPAYNEKLLITKTLRGIPKYVDFIVTINDGSTDSTLKEMQLYKKIDKRVVIIKNKLNIGVGASVKKGLKYCLKHNIDYIVIAAGDNQCDTTKIKEFIIFCEKDNYDVCRGNRFLNQDELPNMSTFRLIGNSLYSFIAKFVSGYYTLFDFQSSYSAIKASKLKEINLSNLRDDYLFDNSLWINLNIVNAKIKEISVPVIYNDEVSDINFLKYISQSIPYLIKSFFNRIYKKYIFALHPVGIFMITGFLFTFFGLSYGTYIFLKTLSPDHIPPTTATVMLSVVPFIVGFQLLLNAIVLDIQNEPH